MKKIIFSLLALSLISIARAQYVVNFENLTFDSTVVKNGKDGTTQFGFTDGNNYDVKMPVFYDTSFGGYWASGWALSQKNDSITVPSDAVKHLFCAKTGPGYNQSATYAIGQNGSYFTCKAFPTFSGFRITNTTYAYNSMKFGDGFAKKFGGKSGKDKDYFYCRIRGYNNGVIKDSSDVYLADFRDDDSTKHFIVRDWVYVNFNFNALADSVTFELYSSDTGSLGINTPLFFAVDELTFVPWDNVNQAISQSTKIWPNPAINMVHVQGTEIIRELRVQNSNGQMVMSKIVHALDCDLDVSPLPAGVYYLRMQSDNKSYTQKLQITH